MKKLLAIMLCVAVAGLAFGANTSTVTQASSNNFAKVEQNGNGNASTISQLTGDQNQVGYKVDPNAKGVFQDGNNNTSVITQDGTGNYISGYRTATGVTVSVLQDGNSNQMYISQVGNNHKMGTDGANTPGYPYHGIEQIGNTNEAHIDQTGGNNNWIVEFLQSGDNNYANIDQIGSDNMIAHPQQIGPSNTLTVLQQGNHNNIERAWEEGSNAMGIIEQIGDDNYATMTISKANVEGYIYQYGAGDNWASVYIPKSGVGDRHLGYIYQNGYDNRAGITMTGAGGSDNNQGLSGSPPTVPAGHKIGIIQEGDGNWAQHTQTGGGQNDALTHQVGNGHTNTINQTGSNNSASVIQM